MSSNNIIFVRKDDAVYQLILTKSDGTAYNLTGCALTLRVKEKRTDADSAALITKTSGNGISNGNATGIVEVSFVPTDTENLEVDKVYDYDLELVTNVLALKFTILRAHFKVLQD